MKSDEDRKKFEQLITNLRASFDAAERVELHEQIEYDHFQFIAGTEPYRTGWYTFTFRLYVPDPSAVARPAAVRTS